MVIQAELRPICYCKGVLEKQILDELLVKQCCDSLKDIQEYTGANLGHDCKITNPSGRCCGSQIKELLNWAKKQKLLIHAPLLEEANSCCNAIIDKTKKKSTAI
jgi:bacterioferritin-associated ferredoxin